MAVGSDSAQAELAANLQKVAEDAAPPAAAEGVGDAAGSAAVHSGNTDTDMFPAEDDGGDFEAREKRGSVTHNIVMSTGDGTQVRQQIAIEAPTLPQANVLRDSFAQQPADTRSAATGQGASFPGAGPSSSLPQHSVPQRFSLRGDQYAQEHRRPAPTAVNLGDGPLPATMLADLMAQQTPDFTRHHKLINRAEINLDGSDAEERAAAAIEVLKQPIDAATPETLGDIAFDLGVQHSKLNQHQMAALYYIKARCSFMLQAPTDQGAELEAVFNIAASHMMLDDPAQTLLTLQPSLLVLDDRERAMAAVGGGSLGSCQSTVALCEAMAGHACVRLNKLEEALVYFQRAYARISRVESDMPVNLTAKLSQDIGALLNMVGRFQEAVAWHVQAINMFEQDGEDEHKAHCLDNLGFCQAQIGDYNQAKQAFDLAIELWRRHGNQVRLAGTLERLGTLMFILDELSHALYFFQQCMKICEACGLELPFLGAAEKCDYIYAKMNGIPLHPPLMADPQTYEAAGQDISATEPALASPVRARAKENNEGSKACVIM